MPVMLRPAVLAFRFSLAAPRVHACSPPVWCNVCHSMRLPMKLNRCFFIAGSPAERQLRTHANHACERPRQAEVAFEAQMLVGVGSALLAIALSLYNPVAACNAPALLFRSVVYATIRYTDVTFVLRE